jgi:uncharacterized protein YdeI (YjbR/CyaY-like superfamily)
MSNYVDEAWCGAYVNPIRRRAEVEITETFEPDSRAAWRAWLDANHVTKKEVWLVSRKGAAALTYRESVYEGLCFGWIDGIAKRLDPQRTAQRFTPRRPKGNWTELNKERARRLMDEGLMTDAGRAVLPDLSPDAFAIASDIIAALQADATTWANFQAFPDLYRRVRISYIEETRKQPEVFATRLANFLAQTALNKLFGDLSELRLSGDGHAEVEDGPVR